MNHSHVHAKPSGSRNTADESGNLVIDLERTVDAYPALAIHENKNDAASRRLPTTF